MSATRSRFRRDVAALLERIARRVDSRLVTDPAELDRLPARTVVRDNGDGVFDRWASDGRWHCTGMSGGPVAPLLPARVIERGELAGPAPTARSVQSTSGDGVCTCRFVVAWPGTRYEGMVRDLDGCRVHDLSFRPTLTREA